MDYKEYQSLKNLRPIKEDEIVFDLDSREHGKLASIRVIKILLKAGYNAQVWYAEDQKSAHVHVQNIQGLAELDYEQRKRYKWEFLKKYTPEEFHPILDKTLCGKHLIAEENKPHYKYHTKKKLWLHINKAHVNHIEQEIYDKSLPQQKRYHTLSKEVYERGITARIRRSVSIIDLARKYGIEVNSSGMCNCPFHEETHPSMKFYDMQGRFHCFGCNEDGNIIKFLAMIKELGFKKNE